MGRRRIGVGFATAVLLGTLAAPAAVASPPHVDVIVQFVDGTQDARGTANDVARQHRATPTFVYEHALQGFAGRMPANRVEALRNDPRVAHVEFDQEVRITAQTVPTGIRRIFATENTAIGIGTPPEKFVDVDVAVIDTGIDATHPDLKVVRSVDCMQSSGGGPPWSRTYTCVSGGTDGNGHGTHVAGTIAARNKDNGVVGVAPGARLHAVRVLDNSGSGSNATVIAGIDWVTAQGDIEVANLSLGGSPSSAVDSALDNLAQSGVAIALAAGNSSTNVSNVGPAGHRWSLTVSALADYDGLPGGLKAWTCSDRGLDDHLATFSNFGAGVDVVAPGVCILSTVPGGGYATYNGTSMAAPHVAGALALLASNSPNDDDKGLTQVQQHYTTVTEAGNDAWTDTSGDGVPEPLLDVGSTPQKASAFSPTFTDGSGGGDPDPPDNQSPTASFTSDCNDLTCEFDASASEDSDGSIVSYAWNFGDGTTGSGMTTSRTFLSGGTYTVTLTVTDDDGATATDSQSVTVTAPSEPGTFTLNANGYKDRGLQKATLSWSGATSTQVTIYRNGASIATVPNSTTNPNAYTDHINNRGGGSYTYQVCEAGTSTCSNEATVTF